MLHTCISALCIHISFVMHVSFVSCIYSGLPIALLHEVRGRGGGEGVGGGGGANGGGCGGGGGGGGGGEGRGGSSVHKMLQHSVNTVNPRAILVDTDTDTVSVLFGTHLALAGAHFRFIIINV